MINFTLYTEVIMEKLKRDDEVLRKIVPGATITKIEVKDDYTEEQVESILTAYPLMFGIIGLIPFLLLLLLLRG